LTLQLLNGFHFVGWTSSYLLIHYIIHENKSNFTLKPGDYTLQQIIILFLPYNNCNNDDHHTIHYNIINHIHTYSYRRGGVLKFRPYTLLFGAIYLNLYTYISNYKTRNGLWLTPTIYPKLKHILIKTNKSSKFNNN
jgi:hypothetical protein